MPQSIDNRRFFTLSSVAVIGDMLLLFSFTENTADDIIGLSLSALLSAFLAVFLKWVSKLLLKSKLFNNGAFFGTVCVALSFVLLATALFCIDNFSNYASNVMLDTKEPFIAFITISLLAVILGFSKIDTLLKLALLLFSIVSLLIVLMFCFSVSFMEIKYLIPYKTPTFSGSFSAFFSSFPVFVSTAIPLTIIGTKVKKGYFALSYAVGTSLVILAFINILLVFGSEFAATLNFPYSKAVSTAALGHIFSRLDVFLYAVCFFTCLIKASVCLSAFSSVTSKLINKILLEKN